MQRRPTAIRVARQSESSPRSVSTGHVATVLSASLTGDSGEGFAGRDRLHAARPEPVSAQAGYRRQVGAVSARPRTVARRPSQPDRLTRPGVSLSWRPLLAKRADRAPGTAVLRSGWRRTRRRTGGSIRGEVIALPRDLSVAHWTYRRCPAPTVPAGGESFARPTSAARAESS
jgi:hypothetical protein